VPVNKNIGVHQFKNYPGSSSFYIQRNYGHYIVFADFLQNMDYEFFKSKGGVYRQFLADPSNINQTHIEIFSRFGASIVVKNTDKSLLHPDIPIEFFNDDFFDHTLKWFYSDLIECVMMLQRGKKILFFGPSYRLTDQMMILKNDEDITESLQPFFQEHGVSYCFFNRHEGEAIYSPQVNSLLRQILRNFPFPGRD
jgi:hypothetical protein